MHFLNLWKLFTFYYFQEVHAPILNHWAVKILVIAFFFGLAMAGIVSWYIFWPWDMYMVHYFISRWNYLL